MVTLVCDICGKQLTMGAGGVATCTNCGMQYSAERLKEKVIEMQGTQNPKNTQEVFRSGMLSQINTFLDMAKSVQKAGNNLEAEIYCNKVLEVDPSNYEAWIIKGQASGWQSTLANPRINEGIQFIAKGINYAPDELRQSLLNGVESEISKLLIAMNNLRKERFEKWPDADEASAWMDTMIDFSKAHLLFAEQAHCVLDKEKLFNPLTVTMEQTAIRTWNGSQNDYTAAKYPDENRWNTFVEKSKCCLTLMECAALFTEDYDTLIHIYENLITMREFTRDSVYWEFKEMYVCEQWVKYPDPNGCYSFNSQVKADFTNKINEYKRKLSEVKGKKAEKVAEEARKKREEYWEAHAEERKRLEEERDHLNSEIYKKEQEIKTIPGKDSIDELQKKIDGLIRQKSSLGLFKGKEKKMLQDEIDNMITKQKSIKDRMEEAKKAIEKELEPLKKRMKNIQYELTCDR